MRSYYSLANDHDIWSTFVAVFFKADFAVLAKLLVLVAGIRLSLALARLALMRGRALVVSVVASLALFIVADLFVLADLLILGAGVRLLLTVVVQANFVATAGSGKITESLLDADTAIAGLIALAVARLLALLVASVLLAEFSSLARKFVGALRLLLASVDDAVVSLGALKVVSTLSLLDANTVLTSLSLAAVTLMVAAKLGNAPVVGANLAWKTLGVLVTSVKGLLLAVAKGIAELAIFALAVRATDRSNSALLAQAVNVAEFVQLALGIDLASEMVATTAAALRVTDFAILALSVVAAFVVLLGLACTVEAAFVVLALIVEFALGAFSLLADFLGVAKMISIAALVVLASGSVSCLADSPAGADLAPFAVRVLLTVGEDNLLTVAALIADLTVLAILVGGAFATVVDLARLIFTARTRDGLTSTVAVAHFAGLALGAALALRALGSFTDGL